MSYFENGKEFSVLIKFRKFVDLLGSCWLIKDSLLHGDDDDDVEDDDDDVVNVPNFASISIKVKFQNFLRH